MENSRTYSDATPFGGNADQGDNRAVREAGNGGVVSPGLAALVRMLASLAVDDLLHEKPAPCSAALDLQTKAQGDDNG